MSGLGSSVSLILCACLSCACDTLPAANQVHWCFILVSFRFFRCMEKPGTKRDAGSSVGGGDLPGAKVGKTGAQPVWVKVKGGGAVEYRSKDLTDIENVSNLLKKVKDEEGLPAGVRLDQLKLYKCEADAADPAKADTPNKYTNLSELWYDIT